MSREYNESGHFIHASRRMAPPQSQILLGTCKSDAPPPTSARQHNDAAFAANAARQAKLSQLQSAMWTGSDQALSPAARARLDAADNKWILGGAHRRFAGASNRSHPDTLFCEPGAAPANSGSSSSGSLGVDITCAAPKRGTRAGMLTAGMNSAEFAKTIVGATVVGPVAPAVPEDHARGVKKIECAMTANNINHAAKVLPSPVRQRTPPPPLPERKQTLRRSSPVANAWSRFGEPLTRAEICRTTGTRYFPERSATPTSILPPPAPLAPRAAAASSIPRNHAAAASGEEDAAQTATSFSSRRDIRPTDMLDKNYKPDSETPAAKAAAARRARMSPQRFERAPSPFSAIGLTKKDLRNNNSNNSNSNNNVPLTGSAARMQQQRNQSHFSIGSPAAGGSSARGADVRYVPRKAGFRV